MYYLTWNGEVIEEEIVELSDAKFLRDEYMKAFGSWVDINSY